MNKVIIDSKNRSLGINLRELFKFRDLFMVLAYRDYRIRYAQTYLGFLWAIIQPLATLLVLVLVFNKAAGIKTGTVPYPLFAACGMAVWTYFSYVLSQAGGSIIASQSMIQKIYFPRLIIPFSKALVGVIDFLISFALIIILMLVYRYSLSWTIVYLPLYFLAIILTALSIGVLFSAITVRYRDFQHIIPFIVQFGLYITPVAYPADLVVKRIPTWASMIYYLNPMAGVTEGFRFSLLGTDPPSLLSYISFAVVIVLFISSLLYFNRTEKIMADLV